jgi:A/G-specific adenine glycosylase
MKTDSEWGADQTDDGEVSYSAEDQQGWTFEGELSPAKVATFRKIILDYYDRYGRQFPWRRTQDPYHILVSEIMLQQTQTGRVVEKYESFIRSFPEINSLANARLQDVLASWMGLGYNRRAKALKELAGIVVRDFGGKLPARLEDLVQLPGIGRATAASFMAFAFNEPTVFLETNIRRVFLHFFFQGEKDVRDNEILSFVEKTLDRDNPRRWYNALMDYGVMLKGLHPDSNKKSAHYRRQAPFKGSRREIRGMVLKTLVREGSATEYAIAERLGRDEEAVADVMVELEEEGFIQRREGGWTLA